MKGTGPTVAGNQTIEKVTRNALAVAAIAGITGVPIVFNEPWQPTMIGLDLTHQALATPDVVERIRAIDTPVSRFVVEILAFFAESYRDVQGFDAPPVHDLCTVELTGGLTRGMTVADFRSAPDPDCTTSVAVTLDHQRFWQLVTDAIDRIRP